MHGTIYYESPFQVIYPENRPPKVEHALPVKSIPLLFDITILETMPIALGIYMQLLSGLKFD
ncbi:hypothetical protein JOC77_003335 [Peribacillus deserti]|uniref:Uncharacterized protein n=1 Tax=Peribacillus deserti TaxID=673318 RepID=A0ABS2QL48_9BACI|nr:hypothetical protein [Peribacillus deserti]